MRQEERRHTFFYLDFNSLRLMTGHPLIYLGPMMIAFNALYKCYGILITYKVVYFAAGARMPLFPYCSDFV